VPKSEVITFTTRRAGNLYIRRDADGWIWMDFPTSEVSERSRDSVASTNLPVEGKMNALPQGVQKPNFIGVFAVLTRGFFSHAISLYFLTSIGPRALAWRRLTSWSSGRGRTSFRTGWCTS